MAIELTIHQQRLLDASQEQPPHIVDPRNQTAYVLIRSDEYELLRVLLEEERVQHAIHRIARRNAIQHANEDR